MFAGEMIFLKVWAGTMRHPRAKDCCIDSYRAFRALNQEALVPQLANVCHGYPGLVWWHPTQAMLDQHSRSVAEEGRNSIAVPPSLVTVLHICLDISEG